jgi:acyl-CoA synthetase
LILSDITDHLSARGVTREWFPEYLVVMELPRSSGGKIAKGELRAEAGRRFAEAAGSVSEETSARGRTR